MRRLRRGILKGWSVLRARPSRLEFVIATLGVSLVLPVQTVRVRHQQAQVARREQSIQQTIRLFEQIERSSRKMQDLFGQGLVLLSQGNRMVADLPQPVVVPPVEQAGSPPLIDSNPPVVVLPLAEH